MKKGFLFDLNKCVGCHACVVACQIENGKDQQQPWRAISTFNALQHPDLPVFHFSLACNHCDEAPCMQNCPALAFIKNEGLQTIEHIADKCIGCKYCTWACPYDAPQFINTTGVVEKCTLCQHRLEVDQKPACANLCPTGALDYTEIELKHQRRIPGFTEAGIGPHIDIKELRRKKGPQMVTSLSTEEHKIYNKQVKTVSSKITLRKEWVLLIFTLIVSLLTGYLSSGVLNFEDISPWMFLGAGISGLVLSSIHLGKKTRAWRAILNLKNSWLSREILFYGLFIGLGTVWFISPGLIYIGYAAALSGFAAAWSVDKVYHVNLKTTRIDWHSSSVFLSSLLFMALFTNNHRLTAMMLGIKAILYLYRNVYFITHKKRINWQFLSLRLIAFIIPIVFWPDYFESFNLLVLISIATGEIIDRIEFYLEADVISPQKQIALDVASRLEYKSN